MAREIVLVEIHPLRHSVPVHVQLTRTYRSLPATRAEDATWMDMSIFGTTQDIRHLLGTWTSLWLNQHGHPIRQCLLRTIIFIQSLPLCANSALSWPRTRPKAKAGED